jgi:hypothetical protein
MPAKCRPRIANPAPRKFCQAAIGRETRAYKEKHSSNKRFSATENGAAGRPPSAAGKAPSRFAGFPLDIRLPSNRRTPIFDALDSSGCCLKTEFDLSVPRVSPAGKSQSEPTPIAPEANLRPDWNQSRADGIGDTNPQEARVNLGRVTFTALRRRPLAAMLEAEGGSRGGAARHPGFTIEAGRLQDAEDRNQAKKAGTKLRPDPTPTGKSDYAGLAGVFFKER